MYVNINFFACYQSFLVSLSSLFSRVARYAPSKKLKNLLKNHLTTFTKSNDRFGIIGLFCPIRCCFCCTFAASFKGANLQLGSYQ